MQTALIKAKSSSTVCLCPGTYKLNGSGASITMKDATDGNKGLYFFDTATNTSPVDADGNGSYDNLSDAVTLSGGGYAELDEQVDEYEPLFEHGFNL